MKKFLLFTTVALLIGNVAFAQDTLALQKSRTSNPYSPAPLITIKGDEIRRFPTTNFMDAVNGLFPWVFSLSPNANEFLFVVNGFLLPDINAISLYDIEEITFSRNDLNGSLYPFSKAGIFYVTTRKAAGKKTTVSFNSQYNFVDNNLADESIQSTPGVTSRETSENKTGRLLSNHASILTSGKRWDLYASAQLDHSAGPDYVSTTVRDFTGFRKDTFVRRGVEKMRNFRSFAQFNYRFSSTLKVGVNGSYFDGKANNEETQRDFFQNYEGDASSTHSYKLPYYYGSAFISWIPLKNLSNHLSFEYADNKITDESVLELNNRPVGNPAVNARTVGEANLKNKRYLLRNELKYTFVSTSKFESGVSTIFSYLVQKADYRHNQNSTTNGQVVGSAGSRSYYEQKLTTLNPSLYFSYNKILSGYAGYAFLLNEGFSKASAASRSNPYAGVVLDLKNMLKSRNSVNRLDLSVNYGNLTRNSSNNYWLPMFENAAQFPASPVIGFNLSATVPVFPNASLANLILKNRLLAVQANAGFMNNRLLAGAEWSELKTDLVYLTSFNPGGGGTSYIALKGTETQKGVSAYLAAKLFEQPLKAWTVRLNLLLPRVTYDFDINNYIGFTPLSDRFQLGLQNNLTIKHWYGQVNGIMALKKKTPNSVNTFLLNYVLIGYDFAGSKSDVMQKVSVFAQARNQLGSEAFKTNNRYFSYGGFGVNVAL